MAKERIAFVIHRYGKEVNSGAASLCRALASHLIKKYKIDILTSCSLGTIPWDNKYKLGAYTDIYGINIIRFKVEKPDGFLKGSIEDIGPYVPSLIEFLKQSYFCYKSIIFITFDYYTTNAGLRLNLPNTIFIPTMHDNVIAKQQIYKDIFMWPKAILYNTPEEKEFVESNFRFEKVPSKVTCYGIDLKEEIKINDLKRLKKDGLEKGKYIIYAGRVNNGKNFNELNEYFLKYKEKNPSELKLLVVGKIDNNMTIRHHTDIVIKGFVTEEEKNYYLRNAFLLVLPSKNESLSIVVLESFSYRRPVLVNGLCAVLKGQCIRSNAGLFYTNFAEFEAELNYLLTHEKIYMQMGNNGYKFVKMQYSWDKVLNNVEALIKEISKSDR